MYKFVVHEKSSISTKHQSFDFGTTWSVHSNTNLTHSSFFLDIFHLISQSVQLRSLDWFSTDEYSRWIQIVRWEENSIARYGNHPPCLGMEFNCRRISSSTTMMMCISKEKSFSFVCLVYYGEIREFFCWYMECNWSSCDYFVSCCIHHTIYSNRIVLYDFQVSFNARFSSDRKSICA